MLLVLNSDDIIIITLGLRKCIIDSLRLLMIQKKIQKTKPNRLNVKKTTVEVRTD